MTKKTLGKTGKVRARHTITPTEAQFMMALWRHERAHHTGATAEELSKAMENSVGMVRKLAMRLSNSTPKYVDSAIANFAKSANGIEKTISVTRYYLTENIFGKWPRTGVFLLEARDFPQDENRTVSIDAFKAHLKNNYGYTDEMFNEDWVYFVPRGYLHQYGERFTPGMQIDLEDQYLQLLRREYPMREGSPSATAKKKK